MWYAPHKAGIARCQRECSNISGVWNEAQQILLLWYQPRVIRVSAYHHRHVGCARERQQFPLQLVPAAKAPKLIVAEVQGF